MRAAVLALNVRGSLEGVIPCKCGFDCLTSGKANEAGWVPGDQQTKEGDMRTKCAFIAAVVAAFTLGSAQTALAENDATGSIGTVQTGNVSATPSVGAAEAGATAAVSAPTTVAGTGNNTASASVGAVQVGGGNTSSNSIGSVQSSPVSSSPSASAGAG